MVSPFTTADLAVAPVFTIIPPGFDVTLYPVMGELPLFVGSDQLTVAVPSPEVVVPIIGGPGFVGGDGVIDADAADGADVPMTFVAVIVNVYPVPLTNPVTVAVVTKLLTLITILSGDDVIVYPVIGDPPLVVGIDHDNTAV